MTLPSGSGQWGGSVPLEHVVAGARFGVVMAVAAGVLIVLERRRKLVTRFLHEESTALNLAVVRVVVMGAVLWETRLGRLLDFAALDPALMVAPRGWELIAPHLPLAAPLVIGVYVVLVVAATLGLVGLFGRAMCGLTALSALYLHSIAQLFGKVNHTTNHLILFSALLAVSPSCDALSIDAIRAAIRDADRGLVRRITPARAYAVVLQTMMLYIGLAYFFPGAWKIARAGLRWFSADNMGLLVLSKLQEFPITPLQYWVVDRSSLLVLITVVTIVFEIGFVFAILDRQLRPAAAFIGVSFHQAIAAVMGIWFTALQATYVVFIDWTGCLRWIAGRRHIEPITLCYGSGNAASRRLVGLVVACDWLDLVRPVAIPGDASVAHDAPMRSWTVTTTNGSVTSDPGAVAAAIAERIPVVWPLGRLRGARALHSLAGFVARLTMRAGPGAAVDASPVATPVPREVALTLRCAAAGLLGSFTLAGLTHAVQTWPIACYPTFDVVEVPYSRMLSVTGVDSVGRTHTWTLSFDPAMGRRFGTDRWRGLVATVLNDGPPFDSARAHALLDTWRAQHGAVGFRTVTFYRDTYPLTRDHPRELLDRHVIGTLTVAARPK